MDEDDVVHMFDEILLTHEKEQNDTICSNMNRPRNRQLSEVRERKTNTWYCLYTESYKMVQMNLLTKQK